MNEKELIKLIKRQMLYQPRRMPNSSDWENNPLKVARYFEIVGRNDGLNDLIDIVRGLEL